MVFEAKNYYVDLVDNRDERDLKGVLEVYNSNRLFLINHMAKSEVRREWVLQELADMRAGGFHSYKIVDKPTEKIVGILEFKVDEETYLSLLMLHIDFQGKGLGKLIYGSFEEYAKSLNSKCMRIDVVVNYDNSVLNFWINNGFTRYNDVELNWTGKVLPAVIMKKFL